jgi:hypothetical protein
MASLALLLAAFLVAFSGCGSGSTSPNNASTSPTANRSSQQVKFAACMRQHGVPLSDPAHAVASALNSGVSAGTIQAAVSACRQYQAGASGAVSDTQRAQYTQAFVKYATCMRANGIDLPDPAESGGNGFGQKLLAASSLPNFPQANAKCRSNLPVQFAGGGSGG